MENYRKEQLKKHGGVQGWLLLFCLVLIIGTPLGTLYNLTTSYKDSAEYFTMFSGLERMFYIDGFVSLLLIILSIRAGIALWTRKVGAVRTAKNYLLIFLIYSGLAIVLPFTVGLPEEINEFMIPGIIKSTLQSLVFFGVWYWYLSVSKRVKATYSCKVPDEMEDVYFQKFS